MKTTPKTPFKNYTTINNELIAKLGCSDVYRAYVLSLTTDKTTNSTDTTIAQLAGFCNESKRNYDGSSTINPTPKTSSKKAVVLPFPKRLEETKKVRIEYKRNASEGFSKTHLLYTFIIGKEFRMIGKELIETDLENKLKGYLIKLYSIAYIQNTIYIEKSQREIYKLIGVDPKTQRKYNNLLIEKGILKPHKSGFNICINGIEPIHEPLREGSKMIMAVHSEILYYAYKARFPHDRKPTMENINTLFQEKKIGLTTFLLCRYHLNKWRGIRNRNALINSIHTKSIRKPKQPLPKGKLIYM